MRILTKILLPVLLLAASLAGAGYLRATRPEVEPAPASERVWTVRVEPAAFADRQPTLKLYGDIVAGREVTLRPLVAGEVVEASPKLVEGGRFAAGELVLAVDRFDYQIALDQLRAELREAEARRAELESNVAAERAMLDLDQTRLEIARRDLERREKLRASQAVSQKSLDDARMAVVEHQAALAKRRQAIAMLEARLDQQTAAIERLGVAIRRAERDLANTVLRAPFAGFVTDVTAAVGKRLGVGDPVARLIDQDRLEVRFTLPDADFGRLWQEGLIGRPLEARWKLGATTFAFQAEITRVESTIDATAGGVEIYAAITGNPDDAPLRPGAFVEVLLPDRLYRDVAELPLSALFHGDTVYVVDRGRLDARPVQVLAQLGERLLLRGDFAAGEPIVTSRLAEIAPGLKVKVAE